MSKFVIVTMDKLYIKKRYNEGWISCFLPDGNIYEPFLLIQKHKKIKNKYKISDVKPPIF
jgi:hypothetical protein